MTRLIAIVMITGAFSVNLADACDEQAISNAQALYDLADKRETNGSGTYSDLARARKHLLDTQYCAGSISKETYCANMPSTQYVVVENSKKRVDASLLDISSYVNDLKEMNTIKQLCK